jgi:hypothetical protein
MDRDDEEDDPYLGSSRSVEPGIRPGPAGSVGPVGQERSILHNKAKSRPATFDFEEVECSRSEQSKRSSKEIASMVRN